jgi:filamentous hemagglutinin family protein
MRIVPRLHKLWCVLATLALAGRALGAGGVTLDGTAGPAKTLTGPSYTVDAADGRMVGHSLFHSFGRLSITSSESLTFTGPSTTTIIVARVTGGQRSLIDGTIDAQSNMPNAHLYLINPAGITFGPSATLNVGQSFTATTADSVRLSDGTTVSSTGALPALLTIAAPEDFGFASPHQGTIEVQGSRLFVNSGKSIALAAGKVHITQGALLRATNGRVQIVAVGDSGSAHIDAISGGTASITAPPSPGDLTLDSTSRISAQGGAGQVDLLAQSMLIQGTVDAPTQGIISSARIGIQAVGNITIDGGTIDTSNSGVEGSTAGPITVLAGGLLTISNGGLLSANTFSAGAGGVIMLLPHDILIDGAGAALTGVTATADSDGAGGSISVQTHNLTLRNGGTISTVTFADGNAGSISVTADKLDISGNAGIIAQTGGPGAGGAIHVHAHDILITGVAAALTGIIADTKEGASGNGGQIDVVTDTLRIEPLGGISTTTNGSGAGGGISITARSIRLDGGNFTQFTGIGVNTQSPDPSAGNGGDILISGADSIKILSGAGIVANTFGPGAGGNIQILAAGSILVDGVVPNAVATGVFAKAIPDPGAADTGPGGNITLHADSLHLTRGGSINSASDGSGNGGNLLLSGGTAVIDRGGEITAAGSAAGKAGDIHLSYDSISIRAGNIAASSSGTGLGGSLQLAATGDVVGRNATLSVSADHNSGGDLTIAGSSIAFSSSSIRAQAQQDGGSIFLDARNRISLTSCVLNASAGNNGGSIHLDPTFVVLNASRLTANAVLGNGGAILIQTLWYLPSVDSTLTVSSQFGLAGSVAIESPNPLLTSSVASLPVEVPHAEGLLMDSCEVKFRNSANSFLVWSTFNPSALPPLWMPVQGMIGSVLPLDAPQEVQPGEDK